jgi:hypothetical protein
MWKLVIEDDEGNRTVVPLTRDQYSIGRRDGNTIRLTERNVSRDHARLVKKPALAAGAAGANGAANGAAGADGAKTAPHAKPSKPDLSKAAGEAAAATASSPTPAGDLYVLEDLTSYNGVFVNGLRIHHSQDLTQGDLVQIGDYRIILQDESTAAAGAATTESDPSKVTLPGAPFARAAGLLDRPNRLVMLVGPAPGSEFPLDRDLMTVGRARSRGRTARSTPSGRGVTRSSTRGRRTASASTARTCGAGSSSRGTSSSSATCASSSSARDRSSGRPTASSSRS